MRTIRTWSWRIALWALLWWLDDPRTPKQKARDRVLFYAATDWVVVAAFALLVSSKASGGGVFELR